MLSPVRKSNKICKKLKIKCFANIIGFIKFEQNICIIRQIIKLTIFDVIINYRLLFCNRYPQSFINILVAITRTTELPDITVV